MICQNRLKKAYFKSSMLSLRLMYGISQIVHPLIIKLIAETKKKNQCSVLVESLIVKVKSVNLSESVHLNVIAV